MDAFFVIGENTMFLVGTRVRRKSRIKFLMRARRERPRGRAAEKRDELAPFHRQFLPCCEGEDSTAGELLHCGIPKEPLSVWVTLDIFGRSDPSIHVRYCSNSDNSGRERLNRSRRLLAAMPDRVDLPRIAYVSSRIALEYHKIGKLAGG